MIFENDNKKVSGEGDTHVIAYELVIENLWLPPVKTWISTQLGVRRLDLKEKKMENENLLLDTELSLPADTARSKFSMLSSEEMNTSSDAVRQLDDLI